MNPIMQVRADVLREALRLHEQVAELCEQRCKEIDEETLILCGGWSMSKEDETLTPEDQDQTLKRIHYQQLDYRSQRWLQAETRKTIEQIRATLRGIGARVS